MGFTYDDVHRLFGLEAAEDEQVDSLQHYYYKGRVYDRLKSNLPLSIIVAHKGVGKSALLRVCAQEDTLDGNFALEFNKQDVLDNQSGGDLSQLVQLSKWKICNSIFRKFVKNLEELLSSPDLKNEPSVWNELSGWSRSFNNVLISVLGKGNDLGILEKKIDDYKIKEESFYRIFKNDIFKRKKLTIYIDDLDLGWTNTKHEINTVSAILNAIREIIRKCENKIRFRIALRSSVYYSVRTSDESTDKFENQVVWLSWTNDEIYRMLVKRILAFYDNRSVDDETIKNASQQELTQYIENVFEPRFKGSGKWENAPIHHILLSLIRKRPRDLIKLCTLAAHHAVEEDHDRILTEDLESVFVTYSRDRLQDTINEYQTELSNIEELLLQMKPSAKESGSCIYKSDELNAKLNDVINHLSNKYFKNNTPIDAQNLKVFLYKINFMTARKVLETGKIQRLYYEEQKYVINEYTDLGWDMEIHPAYRWALQPLKIDVLHFNIDL